MQSTIARAGPCAELVCRAADPASRARAWRAATPVPRQAGLTAAAATAWRRSARATSACYREIFALQDEARWDAADVLIAAPARSAAARPRALAALHAPDAYRSTYDELARLARALRRPSGRRPDLPPGAARAARPARRRRRSRCAGYLGGSGQERQEVTGVDYRSAPRALADEDAAVRAWREDDRQAGRQPASRRRRRRMLRAARDPEAGRPGRDRPRPLDGRARPISRRRRPGGARARRAGPPPEAAHRAGDPLDRRPQRLAARPERSRGAPLRGPRRRGRGRPSERALARGVLGGARLLRRLQSRSSSPRYLRIAAEDTRLLWPAGARRARRGRAATTGPSPSRSDDGLQVLVALPGARRALALGQVGESERAEQEIRKLAARA